MRFLVDAQLPPALARWLVAQGHEAEHVADQGLRTADDRTIWRLATRWNAVLVTKDGDFAVMSTLESQGPVVLWVRRGNTRRQELIRWFGAILPAALGALEAGERLVELS